MRSRGGANTMRLEHERPKEKGGRVPEDPGIGPIIAMGSGTGLGGGSIG